jgi:hypothetical protein
MSLSYKHLLHIRQIALFNVMNDDVDFYIENAYRFYSNQFHTPLHIAKELIPEAAVVQILMEHEMKDWTAEEISDLKAQLNDVPKIMINGASSDAAPEEVDNEAWIAQQNLLLKKQDAKEQQKKNKEQEEIMTKTHEAINQLTESLKNLNPKDD